MSYVLINTVLLVYNDNTQSFSTISFIMHITHRLEAGAYCLNMMRSNDSEMDQPRKESHDESLAY